MFLAPALPHPILPAIIPPMNETTATLPLALSEIAAALQSRLPELRQTYGVSALGIFGSYAAGQAGPGSDLDLLVEFDRAPTLFQFVRLERQLSQMLGVKVDLAMKSALKPEIGQRILRQVTPLGGPSGYSLAPRPSPPL